MLDHWLFIWLGLCNNTQLGKMALIVLTVRCAILDSRSFYMVLLYPYRVLIWSGKVLSLCVVTLAIGYRNLTKHWLFNCHRRLAENRVANNLITSLYISYYRSIYRIHASTILEQFQLVKSNIFSGYCLSTLSASKRYCWVKNNLGRNITLGGGASFVNACAMGRGICEPLVNKLSVASQIWNFSLSIFSVVWVMPSSVRCFLNADI